MASSELTAKCLSAAIAAGFNLSFIMRVPDALISTEKSMIYLHSPGANAICKLPAVAPAKPFALAPAAIQRQVIASVGGAKATVPAGRGVPMGALGVRVSVPPPALTVMVTVMTPLAGSIVMPETLRVADGVL